MRGKHDEDFYPSPSSPFLGDEAFIVNNKALVKAPQAVEGNSRTKQHPLNALAAATDKNIPRSLLCSRSQQRSITAARKKFVLAAIQEGHAHSQIARFLSLSPAAISKILSRNHSN
ncbi:MAG: hypothetical protein A3G41_05205 [Elusimicrobia bacterium RIFCSPLOWO2_12_FULL_59_9]|nr:MAG: hypothetical protein A3G41_05205 [Elusimicrobia bacterium RIFCSPLOWO2_12_FULL_59_9]